MDEQYQKVQRIKQRVIGPSLTVDQLEGMSTDELRADVSQRTCVEKAAIRAVEDGECRQIPVTCILCARGQIDCNGVREIVIGERDA